MPSSPPAIFIPAIGGGAPGVPGVVFAPSGGGGPPGSPLGIFTPPLTGGGSGSDSYTIYAPVSDPDIDGVTVVRATGGSSIYGEEVVGVWTSDGNEPLAETETPRIIIYRNSSWYIATFLTGTNSDQILPLWNHYEWEGLILTPDQVPSWEATFSASGSTVTVTGTGSLAAPSAIFSP